MKTILLMLCGLVICLAGWVFMPALLTTIEEASFDDDGIGVIVSYDSTTGVGQFAPLEILLHLEFPLTGFFRSDYAEHVKITYVVIPYLHVLRFQTTKTMGDFANTDTVRLFWDINRHNRYPIQVGKARLATNKERIKLWIRKKHGA